MLREPCDAIFNMKRVGTDVIEALEKISAKEPSGHYRLFRPRFARTRGRAGARPFRECDRFQRLYVGIRFIPRMAREGKKALGAHCHQNHGHLPARPLQAGKQARTTRRRSRSSKRPARTDHRKKAHAAAGRNTRQGVMFSSVSTGSGAGSACASGSSTPPMISVSVSGTQSTLRICG